MGYAVAAANLLIGVLFWYFVIVGLKRVICGNPRRRNRK